MMPFDLVEPGTLSEALALLDPEDPTVRAFAGGTALMLMMKSGFFRPKRLVSLNALRDDIARLALAPSGELRIGAMVRLAELERAPEIRRAAPVIAQTLRTHSNPRVRNVATIGGNLAHADPHMDLPPVLVALGAEVEIAGPAGRRRLPVDGLVAGYYETVLRGDELIVALIVPPQGQRRALYVKCTTRAADDWPALGLALSVEAEGAAIRSATIVLGAATERPMRLATAESLLAGRTATAALRREAGRAAAAEAAIIADARGSAAYKRRLLEVELRRALARLLGLPAAGEAP